MSEAKCRECETPMVQQGTTMVSDYNRLKRENTDLRTEIHFGNCPNCEAIYCCPGASYTCGCAGWPVGFKTTDKCDEDRCQNKHYEAMRLEITRLENVILEVSKIAVCNGCVDSVKDAVSKIVAKFKK